MYSTSNRPSVGCSSNIAQGIGCPLVGGKVQEESDKVGETE